MSVLVWLALLWGHVYLLTQSTILSVPRMLLTAAWGDGGVGRWATILMYCPACAGFWMALLLHQLAPWPGPEMVWAPVEAMVISCGAMALIDRQWPSRTFEVEQGHAYDAEASIENEH